MFLKLLLISTLAIVYVKATCELIEWTGGVFEFPTEETKLSYKANGRYNPKSVIATRAQIYRDDIYVALPRYKPGVAVTLARVVKKSHSCEAVLTPFPNWAAQDEDNIDGLQNVVDIFVDTHGILWALDIGVVNTLENPIRKNPPKVVAFNLQTGKKVKTLDLSGLVVPASRLQYVVADYGADGKPFVYITDAATRSILVFNVAEGKGYRLVLPKATAGSRRDVLYASLVQKGCGNNFLIITYLSGARVFSIRTDYIRLGSADGKIQDLGVKDGKIVILGIDGGSAMFYRYEGKQDIYRWDSNSNVFQKGDLVYKSDNCYLATQVMPDQRRTRMRVLESNFPDYIQGTVGCGVSQRISLMVSHV